MQRKRIWRKKKKNKSAPAPRVLSSVQIRLSFRQTYTSSTSTRFRRISIVLFLFFFFVLSTYLFGFFFFLNSCIPVFSQIFEVFFGGGGGCRHCKMLKYLPPIKLYSLVNGEWISLEFFTPKSNHGTVAADGQYHKNNSCWYLRDILFFSFNYLTIMTKRIQKVKWPKKKKNRKYYNYFVLVLFIYFCLFVCLLFLFKK